MPPKIRPLNVQVSPDSKAEKTRRAQAGLPDPQNIHRAAIVPGMSPSPEHDLIFHGGKTIADLKFYNFYIGGNDWRISEMAEIDLNLDKAMLDANLNNVIAQYFAGETVRSTFLGSEVLSGAAPRIFSRGDVEQLVSELYAQGRLSRFELGTTAICFMLPSGSVLTDNDAPAHLVPEHRAESPDRLDAGFPKIRGDEEVDSLHGLGGYHGSVHVVGNKGEQQIVYYAIGCYSEQRRDGTRNGIPVFEEPWKNVIATFYHELQEIRTDPDVEDAIKAGMQPGAIDYLGWVSVQGEEIGDFPVFVGRPMEQIFQEVRLADGTGSVPVQIMYSNAVHGPEGPIDVPHAIAPNHGAFESAHKCP